MGVSKGNSTPCIIVEIVDNVSSDENNSGIIFCKTSFTVGEVSFSKRK
jgi:hypothetical protein